MPRLAPIINILSMGIIVLAVAIPPLPGVGGRQIFKAETPGPMKDTKLTPTPPRAWGWCMEPFRPHALWPTSSPA
jgi:hypothetical protein